MGSVEWLRQKLYWLNRHRWGCLFSLIAIPLIIWGVIEVLYWWLDRTIGSSDDWSGIWVFGLGVVAVFFIWNLFD